MPVVLRLRLSGKHGWPGRALGVRSSPLGGRFLARGLLGGKNLSRGGWVYLRTSL